MRALALTTAIALSALGMIGMVVGGGSATSVERGPLGYPLPTRTLTDETGIGRYFEPVGSSSRSYGVNYPQDTQAESPNGSSSQNHRTTSMPVRGSRSSPAPDWLPEPDGYARSIVAARYVTRVEMMRALLARDLDINFAARMVSAWALCEAPYYDVNGVSIGIDLYPTPGDNGYAVGPGQFRTDVWGDVLAQHDEHSVEGAADIAVHIVGEYARRGLNPANAWPSMSQQKCNDR